MTDWNDLNLEQISAFGKNTILQVLYKSHQENESIKVEDQLWQSAQTLAVAVHSEACEKYKGNVPQFSSFRTYIYSYLGELIDKNYVTSTGRTRGKKYHITDKGIAYLNQTQTNPTSEAAPEGKEKPTWAIREALGHGLTATTKKEQHVISRFPINTANSVPAH